MKNASRMAFTLAAATTASAADAELLIWRAGSRPVASAPATNVTGQDRVEMFVTPTGAERTSVGQVSSIPGARTHWHTHPLGQTLIVTAGACLVRREGGPIETIREGDVVRIAPMRAPLARGHARQRDDAPRDPGIAG